MKKRRAFFFGGPVGASLLIALLPGPCTTFDDVTPPADDAASGTDSEPIVDAAPYDAHCGVTFNFAPDATICQMYLDNGTGLPRAPNCCKEEHSCANTPACAAWVKCANRACDPGTHDAECAYSDCGVPNDEFRGEVDAFAICRSEMSGDPNFCRWP